MADRSPVPDAREAFAARAWSAAAAAYREADAAADDGALAADDLERWGLSAFLAGHDADSDAARERAHHAYARSGDPESAARVAFWLGLAVTLRGEPARGGGWFARMARALDEAGIDDSVWRGFGHVPAGMGALFGGDPATARNHFEQALDHAERFDDPDLRVLGHHGHGQAIAALGDVEAGLSELDEVMVAVTTTDDVSPQLVGLVYCAVIDICRDSFDVHRAQEWTEALSRWCAAQPELVPYRGQCVVHRAEILQLHGSWPDAMAEVDDICARLGDPPTDLAAGIAFYRRGELHRLLGDDAAAEAAYRRAAGAGHDPQPGLALLRVRQGRTEVALAAIRRALDETRRAPHRARLLPAHVEIALCASDLDDARTSAEELTAAAEQLPVPLLSGAALHATGSVLLAAGDAQAALGTLRRAWSAWQDVAAPYDAACSRVLVALACRALGDDDTAEMELDAARWVFEELRAAPDVARVVALSRRGAQPARPAGLTLREVQVLQLVATGATNRAIAGELFLSERTVARHVANIFTKIDVTSRSAATAYAFGQQLV